MTAAVVLANSERETDALAAEAAFRRLTEDTRAVAAAGRKEVATALAKVSWPHFRPLLIPLFHDADTDVAREAIRSARSTGPIDMLFVPALVSLLGDRTLKSAARDALVSYGDAVLPPLAHFLSDRSEHEWVRRHIPSVLALIPTQGSMDVLVNALDEPDGFLRYKVVVAIEKLRRDHPELSFAPGPVEALLLTETSRYYAYLTLRHTIAQREAPDTRLSMLLRALDDKLERTLDRVYRLLALLYPWKDVAAARYTIRHGDGRGRSGAIEYLDNLLGGAVRKNVMPIIEDSPVDEKVRRAYAILKTVPRTTRRHGRRARARQRSDRRRRGHSFHRAAAVVVAERPARIFAGASTRSRLVRVRGGVVEPRRAEALWTEAS